MRLQSPLWSKPHKKRQGQEKNNASDQPVLEFLRSEEQPQADQLPNKNDNHGDAPNRIIEERHFVSRKEGVIQNGAKKGNTTAQENTNKPDQNSKGRDCPENQNRTNDGKGQPV
jgi:hypothetical protein